MGLYFIAAGTKTRNRQRTLERSFSISDLAPYLDERQTETLKKHFPDGKGIYLWGANDRSANDLSRVKAGEYVVDVKNKEVMQVFKFTFYIRTSNSNLQTYLRWDAEIPPSERRPYRYVYFLKLPTPTVHKQKDYFQTAFQMLDNRNWLVGQTYFDGSCVVTAMKHMGCPTVEDLLGIRPALPAVPEVLKIIEKEVLGKGEFDPSSEEDARERSLASIVRRRGQPAFRDTLLTAYTGTCAVTGCDTADALEAAHILPYRGAHTNAADNGLLLRADIHSLFDLGLLGVSPEDYTVILHQSLRNGHYGTLHGVQIHYPPEEALRPNRQALAIHRQRFGL